MAGVTGRTGKQRGEQVLQLLAGQPDQPGWWRVPAAVDQRRDLEDAVSVTADTTHVRVPATPACQGRA
jgi:hypothetical protein